MPKIPALLDMLKAGVHFGHRTSRWHPKMAPYIFGVRSGVHIIDIEKTQVMLLKALTFVEELTARGGNILFISTKGQFQSLVAKYANEAEVPYVNTRWLGGTFTNFVEIEKLIKNYLELKDKREKGELKKYTKLEQLQFDRKIEELEEKIGGISTLKKLPNAVFVLDIRHDKTAVTEAKKTGMKIVGVCDTNVNPAKIDYVIPANDDAIASLTMITRLMAEAVKVGKSRAKAGAVAAAEKAEEVKEQVKATESDKAKVEDLDDKIKDQLAKESSKNK